MAFSSSNAISLFVSASNENGARIRRGILVKQTYQNAIFRLAMFVCRGEAWLGSRDSSRTELYDDVVDVTSLSTPDVVETNNIKKPGAENEGGVEEHEHTHRR